MYVSAIGVDDGLSFSGFIQSLAVAAFHRSNADLLELHKRTAPRLLPVEQALGSFLTTNVLPLARRRDLLGLRRHLQQDDALQRMLVDNADAILDVFHSIAVPGVPPLLADDEGALDILYFVGGLEQMGLVRDLTLQLTVWQGGTQPSNAQGAVGDYVTKTCRSKLSRVDARQACMTPTCVCLRAAKRDGGATTHLS